MEKGKKTKIVPFAFVIINIRTHHCIIKDPLTLTHLTDISICYRNSCKLMNMIGDVHTDDPNGTWYQTGLDSEVWHSQLMFKWKLTGMLFRPAHWQMIRLAVIETCALTESIMPALICSDWESSNRDWDAGQKAWRHVKGSLLYSKILVIYARLFSNILYEWFIGCNG